MNLITMYELNQDPNTILYTLSNILEKKTYKILLSTMAESRSVSEIHSFSGIPLSSVYKQIKKLENMGLLYVDKINIDQNGKKVFFYKSKLKSINFQLDEDKLFLNINNNRGRSIPIK